MKTFFKIFVFTSIPFGFFMYLQALLLKDEPSMALYIMMGLVFGLLMALILTIIDRHSKKSIGEDMDNGVHQKNTYELQLSVSEAFQLCKQTVSVLNSAKITYENQEKGLLIFKTGINWRTWGDVVEIALNEINPSSTKISIHSRPRVPTTLVDYGKNAENVQQIINFIKNKEVSF
ncbi:hypothetical protein [Metabacillus litoralis]|uniref:hypothetical protein n=1 Tax=Metabacillus litoralis TaxID=152268 RepID=UPI001CFD1FF1|nr:hypothetical protein [Metabacillus litoralis]